LHKLLIFFSLLLISSQSISAKSIFNQFETQILQIDGKTATIQNSDDIVIGSSGIVTHTFEDRVSTIIARADVIKKTDNKATIRFSEYQLSTQTAFPKPGIVPVVGDRVTLNFLYSRALIVAPNFRVFRDTTEHFKDIEWIHPDIVAAYLSKQSRPNPNREIFQKACEVNSAGLIFFALDKSGYFVDCNNFNTVKKIETSPIEKIQLPFYTRIKDIDTSWIQWSGRHIENFDAYYRALIGQ